MPHPQTPNVHVHEVATLGKGARKRKIRQLFEIRIQSLDERTKGRDIGGAKTHTSHVCGPGK